MKCQKCGKETSTLYDVGETDIFMVCEECWKRSEKNVWEDVANVPPQ